MSSKSMTRDEHTRQGNDGEHGNDTKKALYSGEGMK